MLCMCFTMTATAFAESGDSGLSLTNAEKEALYKEYSTIIEDLTKETGSPVLLVPFNEIEEQDWITPEQFKKDVKANIESLQNTMTVDKNMSQTRSYNTTATKYFSASFATSKSIRIAVTGSFTTSLNPSIGRQVFGSVKSITTKREGGTGTWTYGGYVGSIIDGGRTYVIRITGQVKEGSVTYPVTKDVEFYCSAQGVVS